MANSMHVSVLSCSVHTKPSIHDNNVPGSSANSIRSVAHSTASLSSAAGTSTVSASRHDNPTGMSPVRWIAIDVRAGRPIEMKDRPDSKLTLSSSLGLMIECCCRGDGVRDSREMMEDEEGEEQVEEDRMEDDGGGSMNQTPPLPLKKTLIMRASLVSVASRAHDFLSAFSCASLYFLMSIPILHSVITVTNYMGEACKYLKKLISAMGATFTLSMSGQNMALIAA